jgi:hypothetical protein
MRTSGEEQGRASLALAMGTKGKGGLMWSGEAAAGRELPSANYSGSGGEETGEVQRLVQKISLFFSELGHVRFGCV